jgi:hypothetical protein
LDSNDDYTLGQNEQNYIYDAQAVAQAVKTRLKLLKEEWWEDKSIGLPLFQNIIGVSGTPENIQAIDLLVQDVIINTKDVTSIEDYKSEYSDRIYKITSCTVGTKYGNIQVQEVIF